MSASDTPRTDAEDLAYKGLETWVVPVDFARTLERELAQLVTERDGLREALDAARVDEERLDWLEENMTRFTCYSEPEANGDWYRLEYWKRSDTRATHIENAFGPTIRAAIDAARNKEEQP